MSMPTKRIPTAVPRNGHDRIRTGLDRIAKRHVSIPDEEGGRVPQRSQDETRNTTKVEADRGRNIENQEERHQWHIAVSKLKNSGNRYRFASQLPQQRVGQTKGKWHDQCVDRHSRKHAHVVERRLENRHRIGRIANTCNNRRIPKEVVNHADHTADNENNYGANDIRTNVFLNRLPGLRDHIK